MKDTVVKYIGKSIWETILPAWTKSVIKREIIYLLY